MFKVGLGNEMLELMVMVAWCLWFNRNESQLGKGRRQGSAIVQKASFLLDEFQMTNFKLKLVVDKEETQWLPLKPPWFKLNVDGVNFAASQSASVWVVIWDNASRVEVALSKSIPYSL